MSRNSVIFLGKTALSLTALSTILVACGQAEPFANHQFHPQYPAQSVVLNTPISIHETIESYQPIAEISHAYDYIEYGESFPYATEKFSTIADIPNTQIAMAGDLQRYDTLSQLYSIALDRGENSTTVPTPATQRQYFSDLIPYSAAYNNAPTVSALVEATHTNTVSALVETTHTNITESVPTYQTAYQTTLDNTPTVEHDTAPNYAPFQMVQASNSSLAISDTPYRYAYQTELDAPYRYGYQAELEAFKAPQVTYQAVPARAVTPYSTNQNTASYQNAYYDYNNSNLQTAPIGNTQIAYQSNPQNAYSAVTPSALNQYHFNLGSITSTAQQNSLWNPSAWRAGQLPTQQIYQTPLYQSAPLYQSQITQQAAPAEPQYPLYQPVQNNLEPKEFAQPYARPIAGTYPATIPNQPQQQLIAQYNAPAVPQYQTIVEQIWQANPRPALQATQISSQNTWSQNTWPQNIGITPSSTTPYRIQEGDTLYKIARRFGVSMDAIRTANQIHNPNQISVGGLLHLPSHTLNVTHSQPQQQIPQYIATQPISQPVWQSPQQPVLQPVWQNQIWQTAPSQTQIIPPNPTYLWPQPTAAIQDTIKPHFTWPLNGNQFIDENAVEISGFPGAAIKSSAMGQVSHIGQGPRGHLIVLDHAQGWQSFYLGVTSPTVSIGDNITAQHVLGYIGHAGSTKLRFELRQAGQSVYSNNIIN